MKRGRAAGTLELTILARARKGWFSIKRGQEGGWSVEEVEELRRQLEALF